MPRASHSSDFEITQSNYFYLSVLKFCLFRANEQKIYITWHNNVLSTEFLLRMKGDSRGCAVTLHFGSRGALSFILGEQNDEHVLMV